MYWKEFAAAAPELARLAEERFTRTGLVLVGTIRRDGTPRISPVEPALAGGHLYLGMMPRSKKALDLLRDPRCLVHSTVSDRKGEEGEVKLRGRAVMVHDPDEYERYAQAMYEQTGWRPESLDFPLFRLDIEGAAFIRYQGERQHVQRWPWPSGAAADPWDSSRL